MNLPPTQPEKSPNPHNKSTSADRKVGVYRKYARYIWLGALLGGGSLVVGLLLLRMGVRAPFSGPTFTVVKQKLLVTIVERGSLESAENSDITCRVKAKSAGSTIASTIKWVIDDGTQVKAGDRVIDLDDSGFQEQLKTQKNTVNKAKADWVEADTNCTFQQIENESNIKTAEVNLIQKRLELRKYAGELAAAKMLKMQTGEEMHDYLLLRKNGGELTSADTAKIPAGEERNDLQTEFEKDIQRESALFVGKLTSAYLQDVSVFEGAIETTRSDKETWLDRAKWSQRMVKKGLYSPSQADADQSRLESSEIALRKTQGDLDIYKRFDLEKNVTIRWNDVKEAERNVKKVKIQADSKMKKALADEDSKKAILVQEQDRQRDMENEEKNYKIMAPSDGMVVYFVPEQSRFGGGTQQAIVAQGEPVREGQKLIRIPNLRKMLVNARVHEAMVSKLKEEKTKPTGYGDSLRSTFSLGRHDLLAMLTYQFAFEEIRDKFKDKEQIVTYPGQEAFIRVDAHPGKQYYGNVKTVATVASAAEIFASDVKVYQTMVSVENPGNSERLKPGMSAEVTILADQTKDEVLVIPIQSVVGSVAMGSKRKCYVIDATGIPQEREVEIGKSNDKLVEVTSGLEVGEKVAMNPRPLIPEKSDMKPGTPGTRRGSDVDDDPNKKSGKKKGDGGNFKGAVKSMPGEVQAPDRSTKDPADRGPGGYKK